MFVGQKAEYGPTGHHFYRVYERQTYVKALHPKLTHADLGHLGAEIPFGGGKKFYIGGLKTVGALARVNLTVTVGADETFSRRRLSRRRTGA